MSKAIKWQLSFKSLKGTRDYKLNIYKEGHTGSVKQLTGAANPVNTNEDEEDDYFEPVRTSSGYLRIIDDGTLGDIMPVAARDRFVEIKDASGNIYWQGYIQPCSFSESWDAYPRTLELPLVSALGVLEGVDMAQNTDTASIAELIQEAVSNSGANIEYYVFPKLYDVDNQLLSFRVSRTIWAKENTSENDGSGDWLAYDTESYKKMLEDICRFFGWQMTEHGNTIFFGGADADCTYIRINAQDLDEIAQGRDIQVTAYTTNYDDIEDGYISGSDNKYEVIQGKHKIVVTADFGKVDEIIPMPGHQDKKMLGVVKYGGSRQHIIFPGRWLGIRQYGYSGSSYVMYYNNLQSINDDGYGGYPQNETIITHGGQIYNEENIGGCFIREANYDQASPPARPSYTNRLYTKAAKGLECCRLLGHHYYCTPRGCFTISGNVLKRNSFSDIAQATGSLTLSLRYGNKYWNGTSWQNTLATFLVGFSNGRINDTNTINSGYDEADGYVIPLDSAMSGYVTCIIYGTDQYDIYGISDFNVKYSRLSSDILNNSERSENVYAKLLSKNYVDTYEVTNKIAQYNDNTMGSGFLLSPNNQIASRIQIDEEDIQIEKVNLERYASWYDRNIEQIEVTLKYSALAYQPVDTFMNYDGYDYLIISRSVDYWNDTIKLKLQKML